MRNIARSLIGVVLIVCFVTSCHPPVNDQKRQEARAGLDTVLAQLPELKEITRVKTLVYESYDNEHGEDVCYYAKGYVILGTSLPATEALDAYAQALRSTGWVNETSDEYKTSRMLILGDQERIVVSSGDPGLEIRNAVNYEQLRQLYTSVIVIRVDYTLPKRDNC